MRFFPTIISVYRELHKVALKSLYHSYSFIEESTTTSLSYQSPMLALSIIM